MVETGFTRAKNAGNIIMKNLMDFCLGTVVFIFLGAGLLMGEDALFGLLGVPNLDMFTDFANYDWSSFFFNLVFCATAATIVSGAMAERTKFLSYCIYSVVISAIVYPVEAHWVWGGGWLSGALFGTEGYFGNVAYIDFAGSSLIHLVGGISSFIGALILGPRRGKYLDANGMPTLDRKKVARVRAIPGHNLTIGALGVFILWFCWYGFNGAAAGDMSEFGRILVITTVATAASTCATMIFTWIKNKKPDVSMTLNGSLAGLVAITAGCNVVDVGGALVIGIVAGILVDVAVEVIDKKLHVDDPVGAIAVHGCNGLWGTLAVGLFATETGLFYTGNFTQLIVQVIGIVCISAWTIACMVALFQILKHTVGLRVSAIEETEGLDKHEHGLPSAYADFAAVPLAAEILDTDSPAAPEAAGAQRHRRHRPHRHAGARVRRAERRFRILPRRESGYGRPAEGEGGSRRQQSTRQRSDLRRAQGALYRAYRRRQDLRLRRGRRRARAHGRDGVRRPAGQRRKSLKKLTRSRLRHRRGPLRRPAEGASPFFAAPVRRSVPPSFRGRRALLRWGSPRRRRLPGRRG